MMSGGVRDVEIPVCNVDLSTRTSCVHDLVTFWAFPRRPGMKPKIIPRKHQAKYMTTMDDEGNWAISSEVRNCYAAARKEYE